MFVTTTRRRAATALGLALLGSLLLGGAVRAAPAGGAIHIFVNPSPNGLAGSIVITGAIGDYGTTLAINANGKADPNGHTQKITLKKGTFLVDTAKLDAAADAAQPVVNPATCSGYLAVSEPVTFSHGTGQYAGIAGTARITEAFAFIEPRSTSGAKKGQCTMSNNTQPLAQFAVISGAGTVSFS